MKKILILALGLFLICPQLADASGARNPCYTTGALTNTGILNCIDDGTATPHPVIQQSPGGGIANSSGNVAAATATATLPGAVGRTTFISGFHFTSAGATAASVVNCTVTGVIGGPLSYTLAVVAGATLNNPSLNSSFNPPLAATATNTPIVASCPSLGAGNTNATMTAYGFQQ